MLQRQSKKLGLTMSAYLRMLIYKEEEKKKREKST